VSEDRQACLLLEPDEWEQQDEELLLTSRDVRRKVNPMLGIIVQHSFYDDEIAKARQNPEKMNEVITKLLNVYKLGRVTQWIRGDAVRPLQIQKRITDCRYVDGWQVFVGLDFGGKDDLWAASYLGVNYDPDAAYENRYFADCDVWITEAAMNESPNRPLYERWVADGWLNVCPGEVFSQEMAINRIMEKNEAGINIVMFGYDPAQSVQPINTVKAWLQSLGMDAATIKQMVVPVSQGGMNMNGLIGQLESMILDLRPWIRFSNNPLWPWCFGNCGVYAGKDGTSSLRRVEKMVQTQKIDPVHALLDALYCFDLSEGNIES
jgi:phage terminase large subunit-like protein